MACGDNLVGGG